MAGSEVYWTRGLFRLWLVLAVVWAVAMFLDTRPDRDWQEGQRVRNLIEVATAEASLDGVPSGDEIWIAVARLWQDRVKAGDAQAPAVEGQPWTRYWGPDPTTVKASSLTPPQMLALANAEVRAAEGRVGRARAGAINGLAMMLVPPLMLLVLGAALLWALKGFRRTG